MIMMNPSSCRLLNLCRREYSLISFFEAASSPKCYSKVSCRQLQSLVTAARTGARPAADSKPINPLVVSTTPWKRWKSTSPFSAEETNGPLGELFEFPEVSSNIVGKTASIRRVFGPQSNAEAMIISGGESLAAHASFDPDYGRAKDWIRSHPVGPAVLSPVLVSGLIGALVEAAFPKSVAIQSSMQYHQPLIVGVEVRANIEVLSVYETGSEAQQANNPSSEARDDLNVEFRQRKNGYQVDLQTGVCRIIDEMVIAQGNHSIWIPDYLHM